MEEEKVVKKKKFLSKKAGRGLVVFLSVFIVFSLGFVSGRESNWKFSVSNKYNLTNTDEGMPEGVDFSIFWEAWKKLSDNYIGELNGEDLVYGAISGLLSSPDDPYTVFMEPEDNQKFQEDISGRFDGVGVELNLVNDVPTVVAPLSESPAEKAGLKAKDVILEVDGTKTSEIGFEETINRIRGERGSQVTVKILRSGVADPFDVTMTREPITVESVKWEDKNYQGKTFLLIKVRQFGNDTDTLFKQAAEAGANSKYSGVIVDFRNNPGGYFASALNMASYFIDSGVVVSEVNGSGKKKDFNTTSQTILKDKKVAILINEGSASASEIVAGALKDRTEALLIGENSFGKGSVQQVENLSDGSAVKITVAKWLTPSGVHIDENGIEPAIKISESEDENVDAVLDRALLELSK